MSVSKKSGQTTVVLQYYSLSSFFWNRCYLLKLNKVRFRLTYLSKNLTSYMHAPIWKSYIKKDPTCLQRQILQQNIKEVA